MVDIQRHRDSRKGYCSQLTRLIASVEELMNTNTNDLTEESTDGTLQSLIYYLNRKEGPG